MRDSEVRSTILSFIKSSVSGHPKSIDRMETNLNDIMIYMKDGREFKITIEELFEDEKEINFKY